MNGRPPESKTGAASDDTQASWREPLVEIRAHRAPQGTPEDPSDRQEA